jgi:hypothetical protein
MTSAIRRNRSSLLIAALLLNVNHGVLGGGLGGGVGRVSPQAKTDEFPDFRGRSSVEARVWLLSWWNR